MLIPSTNIIGRIRLLACAYTCTTTRKYLISSIYAMFGDRCISIILSAGSWLSSATVRTYYRQLQLQLQ